MGFLEILGNIPIILIGLLKLLYWYAEAIYRLVIPPPMQSIDGETILVTGAVGGIGKELCKHIVRSGSDIKLVLWDLNEIDLEKFAEELRISGDGKGIKVFPFAVDISTKENVGEGCQKVKNLVGPVTIIFNNAGIATRGNFLMQTSDQIEKTLQVNLMSHFWIIREFLPDMVSKNHGRIVNTCSVLGLYPIKHVFPYIASKFAVNGYSEALRRELEMFQNDGVIVTTVYPYVVKTPIIGTFKLKESANSMIPSSLLEFDEPEAVGRKIVDGVRRGYEYIYFPSFVPLVLLVQSVLPVKFKKYFHSHFINLFDYKDEDQWTWATSFSEVIKGRSSKAA